MWKEQKDGGKKKRARWEPLAEEKKSGGVGTGNPQDKEDTLWGETRRS